MSYGEWSLELGGRVNRDGTTSFMVWAPNAAKVAIRIVSRKREAIALERRENGYFQGSVRNVGEGDRYVYLLGDEIELPDPASRFQPDGVHGPSQIVNPDTFAWEDVFWKGLPLSDFIIYELHTGTFTREGRFESCIALLDYLKELGVTAIEIMPIGQFPGTRNWGYDGVYPFAPQNSYGGPVGLKKLVNACHLNGLAVVLDVVYNHFGPEGNYLRYYGSYFTDRYATPWGNAINFDGPHSDEVRRFFTDNALYWITEYHVDALRLDASDWILDFSPRHFLEEIAEVVRGQAAELGRKVFTMVESDRDDVRFLNPTEVGGYGLDVHWNDSFHHALHTVITGERHAYYQDFGTLEQLAKSMREGFVYSGEYSKYRKRSHGTSSKDIAPERLLVFAQNHDQVGNRPAADRLSLTLSLETLKLVAAVVLLSPYLPLLFMGEEYGEKAPFHFFTSHEDRVVIDGLKAGRAQLFGEVEETIDPQDELLFLDSKINPDRRNHGDHRALFGFYKELIRLRKQIPALCHLDKQRMEVTHFETEKVLSLRRWWAQDRGSQDLVSFDQVSFDQVFYAYNFNDADVGLHPVIPAGVWEKVLDSSAQEWGGQGGLSAGLIESSNDPPVLALRPHSVLLYRMAGTTSAD
jgi:maltooligosyltrehalose trehalohydrolase